MHPRALRRPLATALVLAGLCVPAHAGAAPTFAASPSPSLAAEEPGEKFVSEAWLDSPLPLGAAAGTTLHVGAFVWIRGAEEPLRGATFRVLLHPATGPAEASFDYAFQDFAGHLVADIEVPAGGVGELEIFLPGTVCENDVCTLQNEPIPIRGVGPPPSVPLSAVATASVSPPIEALVTGHQLAFEIAVRPKVHWPAPGLDLPAMLWLQVRVPQGPLVSDIVATLEDAATGHYEASPVFDEAGEYVVEVGSRPEAQGTDLLGGSLRRVTIEAASVTAAAETAGPANPAETSDQGSLPIGLLGAAIAAIGLLALALRLARSRPA